MLTSAVQSIPIQLVACPTASVETTNGITVEPPNRGHFGTAAFVLSSEVVLFSEVV